MSTKQAKPSSSSRKPWTIVRWTLGLAIIAAVIWSLSWEEVIATFVGVGWLFVWINLAVKVALRLLAALKWHLIVRLQDPAARLSQSLAAHLIGGAVGVVAPLAGSDVAVGYAYYRQSRQVSSAISTILMDRAIGIYLLIIIGNVAALVNLEQIMAYPGLWLITLLALGGAIMAPIGLIVLKKLSRLLPFALISSRVGVLGQAVVANFSNYLSNGKDVLAMNALVSVLVQVLRIFSVYTLALAVGAPGSLAEYAVLAPLMFLIMVLPIPAASIGLEQGVFLVMLGLIGVSAEAAFAMAVMNRLLTMVSVLPGVVCIWMGWGLARRQDSSLRLRPE